MSGAIGQINRLIPAFQQGVESGNKAESPVPEGKFTDVLSDLLQSVNNAHQESATAQEMLATGEAADLHQVMIAVEKAGITTDLFLEIRNRLLDGYEKLIQMPM